MMLLRFLFSTMATSHLMSRIQAEAIQGEPKAIQSTELPVISMIGFNPRTKLQPVEVLRRNKRDLISQNRYANNRFSHFRNRGTSSGKNCSQDVRLNIAFRINTRFHIRHERNEKTRRTKGSDA